MGGPFFIDHVGPECLRSRGLPGAARELAGRVEEQLLPVLEGWKDADGWRVEVQLTLHRPNPVKDAARAARPGLVPRTEG